MNKLEQLIKELCRNGVEYKMLGDVCNLVTGATPSKTIPAYWENGTIPWMSSGEVNNKRVFDTETKISQLGYDKTSTTLVPVHSVVIALAGQGKTRGKVAITEIELCTNQSLCSIICGEKINYRFLYYYLDGKYEELRAVSNGDGTRGGLSLKLLKPYIIPVPPLKVQSEIVKVLDEYTENVTALQQELEKELTARKKQYEYYRDLLLDFGVHGGATSDCEWRTLGEISKYRRGSFPQPYGNKEWYDGEGAMPFVQVADIMDNMCLVSDTNRKISLIAQPKSVFAPEGSIIISLQGSIGRIAVTQYDSYIDRTIAIFTEISDRILSKYFVYQLQRVFSIKEKTARGSTIKTITKEEFTSFPIPIPPIEEQERIVSILDRFDKLCNDISEGLPAEIEARRKQYEYYRDKLLSFEKLREI